MNYILDNNPISLEKLKNKLNQNNSTEDNAEVIELYDINLETNTITFETNIYSCH